MKYNFLFLICLLIFSCNNQKEKNEKIKALYLTGGGFHHYSLQEEFVKKGVYESLNNVKIDSFWLSKTKGYFRGIVPSNQLNVPPQDVSNYDVLIFNMCFAKNKEKDFVDSLINLTSKKPSIFIHCAFHTFWDIEKRKQWTEILGVDSRKHNKKNKLQIHLKDKNSPVVNFMNKPFYFSNSRDELYLGKSYSKDIKVLLMGNDYNNKKQRLPILWEINRPKQKSLNITLPHSHTEFNTATYKSFLVNSLLYLTGKSLPYSQYFTDKHKLLRGDDDKLYSYSKPNILSKNVLGKAPYKQKYIVPSKARYFVAKFKAGEKNHKKYGGLFFKIFIDGDFLFHTSDLLAGQKESIKVKLPPQAGKVEIEVGSYDYFYNKKKPSKYSFSIIESGFVY